jgi:N4-gp56 family major capsid protein
VVEVGSALGVRWFVTTHGKIWADGGGTAVTNNLRYTTANTACDVLGTIILAENAYGNIPLQRMSIKTIVKKLGSAGTEDALDQRATVGWKMAEACKILDDNNLIRIESGAPKL